MGWTRTAAGVFSSDGDEVRFSRQEIEVLVSEARASRQRRARICAHATLADPVHEMLICLLDDGYIRPHRHTKAESLHMIEGACDLVLFDEGGMVTDVIRLDSGAGGILFVRLPSQQFHTLLLRTEYVVFHETTRGPFEPADTEFAGWSPSEGDAGSVARYVSQLEAAVSRLDERRTQ